MYSSSVIVVVVIIVIIIIVIKTNIKFPCSLPFSARTSAAAKCNSVKMHIYLCCGIAGGIPL